MPDALASARDHGSGDRLTSYSTVFIRVSRLGFAKHIPTFTDAQLRCVPAILRRESILLTSPTGSGKTSPVSSVSSISSCDKSTINRYAQASNASTSRLYARSLTTSKKICAPQSPEWVSRKNCWCTCALATRPPRSAQSFAESPRTSSSQRQRVSQSCSRRKVMRFICAKRLSSSSMNCTRSLGTNAART